VLKNCLKKRVDKVRKNVCRVVRGNVLLKSEDVMVEFVESVVYAKEKAQAKVCLYERSASNLRRERTERERGRNKECSAQVLLQDSPLTTFAFCCHYIVRRTKADYKR
jgi:hypothetical protein